MDNRIGEAGGIVLLGDASLRVNVEEQLDLSSWRRFVRAGDMLRSTAVERVVVDLAHTRRVLDSGLALLLMLKRHAGDAADRIDLVNCTPAVLLRLEQAGMNGCLHVQYIPRPATGEEDR